MKRAIPLGTRITDRAADVYSRQVAARLGAYARLPIQRKHAPIVTAAFADGALFEVDRLSRALRIDLTGTIDAVPKAAKAYFNHYLRSYRGPDLCSLDNWRRLVDGAFRSGAGFVHAYLWPPQPKPRKGRRK